MTGKEFIFKWETSITPMERMRFVSDFWLVLQSERDESKVKLLDEKATLTAKLHYAEKEITNLTEKLASLKAERGVDDASGNWLNDTIDEYILAAMVDGLKKTLKDEQGKRGELLKYYNAVLKENGFLRDIITTSEYYRSVHVSESRPIVDHYEDRYMMGIDPTGERQWQIVMTGTKPEERTLAVKYKDKIFCIGDDSKYGVITGFIFCGTELFCSTNGSTGTIGLSDMYNYGKTNKNK